LKRWTVCNLFQSPFVSVNNTMDEQVVDEQPVDVVAGGREEVGPDSSSSSTTTTVAAASAVEADKEDETDVVTNQNKNQVFVEEESAVVASDLTGHDNDNIVASPSTIETAAWKEVGIEEEEETAVVKDGDGGAEDGGEKRTETAVVTTTETEARISSLPSSSSSSSSSDLQEEDGSSKQTHNDTSAMDHSRAAENAGSGTVPIPLEDTTNEPNIERELQQQQQLLQLGSYDSDDSVTKTSFKVVAGHDSVEIHEEEEQAQEHEGSVSDDAAGSKTSSPNADKDEDVAAKNSMTGQKQEHEADNIGTRNSEEGDKEEENVVENKLETAVPASDVSKKAPSSSSSSSSSMTARTNRSP